MNHIRKRLLALLLVLAMVCTLLPTVAFAAEEEMPQIDYITAEDDALVEADVLSDIDSYFTETAKRDGERTLADYVAATDDLKELVQASDTYVEDSLIERGDGFFWQTTAGITCGYFPKDRYEADQRVANKAVNTSALATWNYSKATSKDVCLIGPMYSEDSTFTNQYVLEACAIAEAMGGTAYGLIDTQATVTNIGQALEKCGVVIFDSHGVTDWGYFEGGSDGKSEADNVSEANTSYLALSTGSGMTTADCAYVTGTYGQYPHAYKDSYGNYVADGTAFANHMNGTAPNSLLWMAICLGMATEGMHKPLRSKGVAVVYGYSQSVTFAGDYLYEEIFWDNLLSGKTVADSISTMKATYGNWDWSPEIAQAYGYSDGYSTISEARTNYAAFPVVVSDVDAFPGQRYYSDRYGACSLQTVKTTYTLINNYAITATSNNTDYGTVSLNGNVITASPKSGYYAKDYTVLSGTATVVQSGNSFTVNAESDCSIRINFAPKASVTVSFSAAHSVSSQTGYAGDEMTLPQLLSPAGYNFLGWMTEPVSEATTEMPEYFSIFIPTESVTLYALYSYTEEGSASGSGDYVKLTTAPADWSGEYLIVYEEGSLIFDGSRTTFDAVNNYQSVTITNETIPAAQGDAYKVTIATEGSGYSIQGESGKYLGNSSNSNALTTSSSPMRNTLSMASDGSVNIVSEGGAYLRYNSASNQNRFRYYKSSTYSSQNPIALYVKDGDSGITWYTSITETCEHNWEVFSTTEASCTTDGYTTYQCTLCGQKTDGDFIAALGHSYNKVVTAPTCEEAGYTTYTCSLCGDSYTEDPVPANGHDYIDGICCECGAEEPLTPPTDGYEGRYYIATKRSTGNYFYMTNDLGSATTKRYQAIDSGLSTLPVSIAADTAQPHQIFVLEKNTDGAYRIYSEGITGDAKYLGHTSSNSGTFVEAASAVSATVDYADGIYHIYYSASDATRYLALNGTSGNDYFAWYKSGQKQDLVLIPIIGQASDHIHRPTYFEGQDATCTTEGVAAYWYCADETCPYFGICYTEADMAVVIPAEELILPTIPHHMLTAAVHEPTCTEDGYTEYVCAYGCGATDLGDIVPAIGHEMVYTDNGDGTHSYGCAAICAVEDVIETHVYFDGVCPCGAVEVLVPSEANIKIGHGVALESDLCVKYRVKYTDLSAAVPNYVTDGAYLVIEKDVYPANGEMWVDVLELSADLTADPARMVFNLAGIQSAEMGSELRAVLHVFDAEGKEYISAVDVYSIKTYVETTLKSVTYETQPKMVTMLIDLLNYGAAAQISFNRRTDELVNAGFEAYQQYATKELAAELTDVKETISNDRSITAVTKMGFSVNLADKTEINAKLTLAAGYTMEDISKVVILNEAGEQVDVITEFVLLEDGRVQVTFSGVKSIHMRDMFYFVAYVGEAVASDNVGYSVEAAAKTSIAAGTGSNVDAMRACMYYGDSACAYFNK